MCQHHAHGSSYPGPNQSAVRIQGLSDADVMTGKVKILVSQCVINTRLPDVPPAQSLCCHHLLVCLCYMSRVWHEEAGLSILSSEFRLVCDRYSLIIPLTVVPFSSTSFLSPSSFFFAGGLCLIGWLTADDLSINTKQSCDMKTIIL